MGSSSPITGDVLGHRGDPPGASVPSALFAVLKFQILLWLSKPPAQLCAAKADAKTSLVSLWVRGSIGPSLSTLGDLTKFGRGFALGRIAVGTLRVGGSLGGSADSGSLCAAQKLLLRNVLRGRELRDAAKRCGGRRGDNPLVCLSKPLLRKFYELLGAL